MINDSDLTPRPDDLTVARLGRLVLLLEALAHQSRPQPLDVERLAAYDFFADNPLLIFDEGSSERRELLMAGFDSTSLSYHSASQRFANRRSRLQHDLANLLARGLVTTKVDGRRVVYELTDSGQGLAPDFESVYAQAYRRSAAMVASTLNRLSGKGLRARISSALGDQDFLVDLGVPGEERLS